MNNMRDCGVEVLELHNLLANRVAVPEAKKCILDNQVTPNQVGPGLVDEIRSYLEALRPLELAETPVGGLPAQEFPEDIGGEMAAPVRDAAGVTEYLPPPLRRGLARARRAR
jgi:arginine deiminase